MKSINHACVSVRAHLYGPEEFLLWTEESWPLEQDEFFLAEEFAGPGKEKTLCLTPTLNTFLSQGPV